MTDYSNFRKSPDMIDWMRAPQAQHFVKQLTEQRDVAFKNLLATCEKSSDPKVTAAITRWSELNAVTAHIANARREQVGDDE